MEKLKNLKNKITKTKIAVMSAVVSTMISANSLALAAGFDDSVTVKSGTGVDASVMMGKIIGILLTITRFVGLALVIYGIYEIVTSFMQNQPEAKIKGIVMALSGVVMIALKSVLIGMGVIG